MFVRVKRKRITQLPDMFGQLGVIGECITTVRAEERGQGTRPLLLGVRGHVTVHTQLRDRTEFAIAALVPLYFDLEKNRTQFMTSYTWAGQ